MKVTRHVCSSSSNTANTTITLIFDIDISNYAAKTLDILL